MNGNDGTQEKNFECSECGKVFGQRGYLCRMCNCHFYQQGHQVGAELRGPTVCVCVCVTNTQDLDLVTIMLCVCTCACVCTHVCTCTCVYCYCVFVCDGCAGPSNKKLVYFWRFQNQ